MSFRADEAATSGYDRTRNYLIPRTLKPAQRAKSEEVLAQIVQKYGPPVDGYPIWHPLVAQHDHRNPETYPSERCGYRGLDHTRFFTHGFITCPYDNGDDVLASVRKIRSPHAYITAEVLDVEFYNDGTTPILVGCDWVRDLEQNHTIPKSVAVPLLLEHEVPAWRDAQCSETWETMRPYLLGNPHGSRSSLFVTQDTALAMKKIYLAMVESGMFGASPCG